MFLKSPHWVLWLAGWALITQPVMAQWKDWDYELDQEKKPWSELQVQLPSYPKPENLLKFELDGRSANSYYIDAVSISVGDDGVVRYTLFIKAGGGAVNVSFEGLRCESRQVRTYALGHQGGQWARARNTDWRDIQPRDINGYHHVLLRDYYCLASVISKPSPRPVTEIVNTLKRGPPRFASPNI